MPGRSIREILVRTFKEFQKDELTDKAAALTYYSVLALFPGLMVLVALIGVLGEYPRTTDALLAIVDKVGPASAVDTFRAPIEGVIKSKGGAGALLGVGLAGALWSASGYIGAFMRAMNHVYGVREGRPFWKLRPLQVLVTIGMVLALTLIAVSLVVSGSLAQAIGDVVGVGSTTVQVWDIAKWPVMLVIVMAMFAVLYYAAPNVKRRFRPLSPGAIVAVLAWIAASAGFAFYVANFGSYNKTYGTLGGVITFLVWLWISNLALLFGAELDAELERERELKSGLPAEDELQLPPREAPRDEKAERVEQTRAQALPQGRGGRRREAIARLLRRTRSMSADEGHAMLAERDANWAQDNH